jgi:chloramphenicol-sensitive protein RarD
MILVFMAVKKWRHTFVKEAKAIVSNHKQFLAVLCAAILIAVNWLTYIIAISDGHVSEASLGYFINPLLNFLLAIVFLKERLTPTGISACIFAFVGVVVITVQAGVVPWLSIILALTFSLYGLIKKEVQLHSYTSLTIETIMVLPFTFVYLIMFSGTGFLPDGSDNIMLAIGAGVVTAVPMLLFAETTKRITYIAVGFVQYVSPTISFLLAVFVFLEPFPPIKLAGFVLIWIGITVFCVGGYREMDRSKGLPMNDPDSAVPDLGGK